MSVIEEAIPLALLRELESLEFDHDAGTYNPDSQVFEDTNGVPRIWNSTGATTYSSIGGDDCSLALEPTRVDLPVDVPGDLPVAAV